MLLLVMNPWFILLRSIVIDYLFFRYVWYHSQCLFSIHDRARLLTMNKWVRYVSTSLIGKEPAQIRNGSWLNECPFQHWTIWNDGCFYTNLMERNGCIDGKGHGLSVEYWRSSCTFHIVYWGALGPGRGTTSVYFGITKFALFVEYFLSLSWGPSTNSIFFYFFQKCHLKDTNKICKRFHVEKLIGVCRTNID